MLLRNSISNTKRFFQKTLRSFKSFFSSDDNAIDYHKIPKASPYNPYPFTTAAPITGLDMTPRTATHHQDLENFYTDFTDRWEYSDRGDKAKKKGISSKKKMILTTATSSTSQEQKQEGNVRQLDIVTKASPAPLIRNNKEEEDHQYLYYSKSKKKREERSLSVAEKLKELEMMDVSNVDHVLDIEEVLHYYSRLTCPAYLDIVDKFFMETYKEFLATPSSPKTSLNSKPKLLRSARV